MDDVITDLINAGVQFIESGLDYSIDTSGLITQYYDSFEETYLQIWHRYIVETDLVVEYYNTSGVWTAVDSANYRIDTTSTPPKVFFKIKWRMAYRHKRRHEQRKGKVQNGYYSFLFG